MLKDPKSAEDVSSTSSDDTLDATQNDTAGTQDQEGGQAASESSPEADGKKSVSEKEWDPLSVVKKALGEDQEKEEGKDGDPAKQTDKSSKSENDSQKAEDDPTKELGEITEEELKSYKPLTRRRIEKLLDERSRLTERVSTLEPQAEQMNILQEFMQERQLTPANVSELLVVGGLAMSSDPKDLRQALTRVDAFRNQIMSQLGDVLPEDLQKKVDDGLVDAETAKEVALQRVETQRAQNKVKQADTTVETGVKQANTERDALAAEVVHSTISDWQRTKIGSDPDYLQKAELLQKEIKLRVMAEGGKVLDKAKALKIAEEAYTEVNRIFKTLAPSKSAPAKRVVQSKASPGNMASKPNSALDAARAGLAKAHGA